MQKLATFLFTALLASAAGAQTDTADDLPDIGSPAQAMMTLEDEYQIGRMVVRGLRDQDQVLDGRIHCLRSERDEFRIEIDV